MIHIDNGVNIDASWTNHIAVSYDGSNWTTINKEGVNVIPRYINQKSRAQGGHPSNNKGSHGLISLTVGSDDIQLITFDPNDVTNQPTWQGGGTAELQTAVADITGWLG